VSGRNSTPIRSDHTCAQTSFVIAMIIPINTNTTIAICVQIQVGDIV
jgi:hypothetical protein